RCGSRSASQMRCAGRCAARRCRRRPFKNEARCIMTLTVPVRAQFLGEDYMEPEGAAREPASQGPPAEGERRAAPRHGSTLKITCYPVNASLLERRQGRVRNVSRTGVGLLVDRAWQRGATVILELPAEDG